MLSRRDLLRAALAAMGGLASLRPTPAVDVAMVRQSARGPHWFVGVDSADGLGYSGVVRLYYDPDTDQYEVWDAGIEYLDQAINR